MATTNFAVSHADDLQARATAAGGNWIDILRLITQYGQMAITVIEAVLPLLKSGPNGGVDLSQILLPPPP